MRCCRFFATGLVVAAFYSAAALHVAAAPRGVGDAAAELLGATGVERGVCAVVGVGSRCARASALALAIAESSELSVHARLADRAAVSPLREQARALGYDLRRVAVEGGPCATLPYATDLVDLVVIPGVASSELAALDAAEILRVLRPGGFALVESQGNGDGALNVEALRRWVDGIGATGVGVLEGVSNGQWVRFSKPVPEGRDDWSHWEHGPDNNPVSADRLIKAPYMTQFLAEPFYIPIPSVTTAAGGRTFLAIGHIAHHRREWDMLYQLIARNGYNGTILWQRQLPEGYLVHRSAFVATDDTFYMIDGRHCLQLDPQTGEEQGRIRLQGVAGEWKWMAKVGNILYALVGSKGPGTQVMRGDRSFGGWSWGDMSRGYYGKPRIPFGFGRSIAAYDLDAERVIWHEREDANIDSRTMAIRDGKLFYFCPEAHLRARDVASGSVVWTNDDQAVLNLIEEPGKKLTSTPGFRTACIAVATPDALILQGQTRMNVVAVSTQDGKLLWKKPKITNNPNAIFVDDNVILAVGPEASHVVVEPKSGDVLANLGFKKVACTRLTASMDSFFCRGEGMLRFDRYFGKVLVDGAARPACNDGAMPANGLLYLGPWQCDCNLSLIGNVAKCSAGDFKFDYVASDQERLERSNGAGEVAEFPVSPSDWPTYRGGSHRGARSAASIAASAEQSKWTYQGEIAHRPSVAAAANGSLFFAGDDGVVRSLDAASGRVLWEFATGGPVKYPPTIAAGRAFFGSGDGYAYALEASSGKLLWRFRAAPIERHIMVYGTLGSTWPVHSGVLVHGGVCYFAAGIIDQDGTYVYALDAASGKVKWQNNSSGHLNKQLRKGVSVQGNLTLSGDRLLLAGGNQVSPAPYDLGSGRCLAKSFEQGRPKANNGNFLGILRGETAIVGGRVLYSAPQNVSTKGSFELTSPTRKMRLNYGGVAPAWNSDVVAMVNFKYGKLMACDIGSVVKSFESGDLGGARTIAEALARDGEVLWQSDLGRAEKFEVLSLAMSANAVVAVAQYQHPHRAHPQWTVVAYDLKNGEELSRVRLDQEPLPGGLLIDRDGRIVVSLIDGGMICWGA